MSSIATTTIMVTIILFRETVGLTFDMALRPPAKRTNSLHEPFALRHAPANSGLMACSLSHHPARNQLTMVRIFSKLVYVTVVTLLRPKQILSQKQAISLWKRDREQAFSLKPLMAGAASKPADARLVNDHACRNATF